MSEPPQLYPQNSSQASGTSSSGLTMLIIGIVAIPVVLVCGGILVGLLLPAVQAGREAARRMTCANNQKQLALSLMNYEAVYNSLPPAYTVDENGRKLHSWRTLILPFLEQNDLYQRIDLSKPWDDPANAFLADALVDVYRCPSSPIPEGYTSYVVIDHPQGIFSGSTSTRYREISDGTSNTLLLVEVPSSMAVRWMEPVDVTLPGFIASFPSGTNHAAGVYNATLADGSVRTLNAADTEDMLEAFVTKDGGEEVFFGQ